EAAVAVKLHLVEPFLAFGDSLDGEGIHRLDEPQLTRSKDAFGIPYFPRCIHLMSWWYMCCWLRPDERPNINDRLPVCFLRSIENRPCHCEPSNSRTISRRRKIQ